MARPKKIGMDYFPVDTTWDVKMQLVKAKYGLEGIGCIIELFKTIYHEGYYIKWDGDTRLLFASENRIDENKLAEIVGFAVQKGVFHAGKLDKLGILTSRGIQKRWLQVARDSNRSTRELDKNIDLMNETELSAQETEFTAQEMPRKNVVSGTDNPYIILNKIKEDIVHTSLEVGGMGGGENEEKKCVPKKSNPKSKDKEPTHVLDGYEYRSAVRMEWDRLGDKVYIAPDTILFENTWRDISPCIKGIHSDDVIQAIKNFGIIVNGPPGKYWWTARISIKNFFQKHVEKFLPVNFKETDFLKEGYEIPASERLAAIHAREEQLANAGNG